MSSTSYAVRLPSIENLQLQIKDSPQVINVIEPHLSQKDDITEIAYFGYPIAKIFDWLFGSTWQDQGAYIEFIALDGYFSRVKVSRFNQYRAFLAFGIKDKSEFIIDNSEQGEKNVQLGPYYLIWDNIDEPELVAEGATNWPYQITEIVISKQDKQALLPPDLAEMYSEHAELTQKYCLTCHQVNGYGGSKWPINLASQIKKMSKEAFKSWVLNPRAQNPATSMPPLLETLTEMKRQEIADKIYEYLLVLPETIAPSSGE
ncbi:hypothetical protein W03_23280 [Nitrosomonas sp. PY1]|uniref:c-type cytochrome n=1 Tax=Nitrosomonas sp. PY1 TaxID=1803906 RepID=UPI001FC884AE|nr:c-type cytochrome [Nitrosomonas sp. PY1]GKS70324.1 hypothetical protein W03_23280 [Nitrosomonas sp. PY1]